MKINCLDSIVLAIRLIKAIFLIQLLPYFLPLITQHILLSQTFQIQILQIIYLFF